MPELPDVEGFRATLAEHAVDHRIRDVEVVDPGVLHGTGPEALDDALTGRTFRQADRHGKWLLARTDGPTLMLHFGMTGELRWSRPGEPRHRYDRVVLAVDGGELRYRDMRKLQGVWLASDQATVDHALAGLGPDALAVSRDAFEEALSGHRGAVKPALTDQSVIAGLGNLLVDEILWRARIHPSEKLRDLTPERVGRLHDRMREVLRSSVRAGRVPTRPTWLTGVRDDRDGSCPRCGTPLSHGKVGGRSTVWCPHCQPAPGRALPGRRGRPG
jgi:formamidopyrimidine-DNA glycosylase